MPKEKKPDRVPDLVKIDSHRLSYVAPNHRLMPCCIGLGAIPEHYYLRYVHNLIKMFPSACELIDGPASSSCHTPCMSRC